MIMIDWLAALIIGVILAVIGYVLETRYTKPHILNTIGIILLIIGVILIIIGIVFGVIAYV